jgi:hypothetical protein
VAQGVVARGEVLPHLLAAAPALGHRALEAGDLGIEGVEGGERRARLLERGARRAWIDLLGEERDARSARCDHATGVGGLLPGRDPEQRGLPGSVRADEADPVARAHREGNAGEQPARAEALGDAVEVEQHGKAERSEAAASAKRAQRARSASGVPGGDGRPRAGKLEARRQDAWGERRARRRAQSGSGGPPIRGRGRRTRPERLGVGRGR